MVSTAAELRQSLRPFMHISHSQPLTLCLFLMPCTFLPPFFMLSLSLMPSLLLHAFFKHNGSSSWTGLPKIIPLHPKFISLYPKFISLCSSQNYIYFLLSACMFALKRFNGKVVFYAFLQILKHSTWNVPQHRYITYSVPTILSVPII